MFNTGAMELEIPGIADGARRPSVVVSYGLGLDSTCLLLRWLTEPQSRDFDLADMVVADCSFISLRKILPPAVALLRPSGKILALIKPQFEAGKAEADRGGGVIRDAAVHERVLREMEAFIAAQPGLQWRGATESPILGPAGNKEFFALIEKTS